MNTDDYRNSLEQEVNQLKAQIERIALINEISVESAFYSKRKAAMILGISQRTLDRWTASGYISRIAVGGRIYFHKNEVVRVAQLYSFGVATVANYTERQEFEAMCDRRGDLQSDLLR